MADVLGIWHLELEGGKEQVIQAPANIQVTNVSFGEEVVGTERSVIKLSFENPAGSDSEYDEEKSSEENLRTTVLCALTPGKIENATLNLTLGVDDHFKFIVTGQNTVHLTGNYLQPYDDDASDLEDEFNKEDAYDLRDVSSDVEMHPDDLDELSDGSRFEEVNEESKSELAKPLKRARESDAADGEKPVSISEVGKIKNKKLKSEDGVAVSAPGDSKTDSTKTEKKDKKKKEKKPVTGEKDTKGSTESKGETKLGSKKIVGGGVAIQDAKIGQGPMAKKGNTVKMRYIGKLSNGTVFDKNVSGKPFAFHLGKGEVIKGWDEGIVGMQPGGERLITIPPNMGYGAQKQSGIPPNSTLVFEVKLIEIK